MKTRLPYARAVPSGVATNLAVALSASVPLESVAFRASRTADAAASEAEAGICSASDIVLHTQRGFGVCWGCGVNWLADRSGSWSGESVIHLPLCCWSPDKATFPKAVSGEQAGRGGLSLLLFPGTLTSRARQKRRYHGSKKAGCHHLFVLLSKLSDSYLIYVYIDNICIFWEATRLKNSKKT